MKLKLYLWRIKPERREIKHWQTVFDWMKEQRPHLFDIMRKVKLVEIRTAGQLGLALLCFDTPQEANEAVKQRSELINILAKAIQVMRVNLYTGVLIDGAAEGFVPIAQELLQKYDGVCFEMEVE